MPKCTILSEKNISGSKNLYEVIFEADDGWQELQNYQCTELELKDALTNFNDSRLESITKVAEVTEPRVITVLSSKNAQAALAKIALPIE